MDISSDTKQLIHRGRLVEYLAKALLYVEVETHFDRPSSTTCNAGFTLLGKHHCSSSSGSKRLAVAARADDPPPHASAPVSVAHAVRESMAKRKLSAVTGAPEEGANAKRVKSRHSAKGPNSGMPICETALLSGLMKRDHTDDASMHDVVRPPLEPPRPEPARSLVPRSNLTNGRHTEQPPISGHWSISPIGAHAADVGSFLVETLSGPENSPRFVHVRGTRISAVYSPLPPPTAPSTFGTRLVRATHRHSINIPTMVISSAWNGVRMVAGLPQLA